MASAQQLSVSTLAGHASRGWRDGPSAAALFQSPYGVAADTGGNLYVADSENNAIRKISADGIVTTFAGRVLVAGFADGTGAAAQFNDPLGVAVSQNGTVYVADTGNNVIRMISPGGVVSLLAGKPGTRGSADGAGTNARFDYPAGVAVDPAGNLYVADMNNCTIRKIDPSGMVSTLAGQPGVVGQTDGSGSAVEFTFPLGVTVGNDGYIYTTDFGLIRRISPSGEVKTIAGIPGDHSGIDGPPGTATFNIPSGLAMDASGNLWVTDAGFVENCVRMVDSAGNVRTVAGSSHPGSCNDGKASGATFDNPRGLTVTPSGDIYVADTNNNALRRVSRDGTVITIAGAGPGGGNHSSIGTNDGIGSSARFSGPEDVAVDPTTDDIFVADTSNHTIRRVAATGQVSTIAGAAATAGSTDGSSAAARFNAPTALAIGPKGDLLVADTNNDEIRRVDRSGNVSTIAGAAQIVGAADGTLASARFDHPHGIAVAPTGDLFVADSGNNTIRRIALDGTVSTYAGRPGEAGTSDGDLGAARFNFPTRIAVDSVGRIYVSDSGNGTVRLIADGKVSTLAGSAGDYRTVDGNAATARFTSPAGIAISHGGQLYVVDAPSSMIRVIASDGTVTTVAGNGAALCSKDGTGADAFLNARAIAITSTDNLVIADTGDNEIRQAEVSLGADARVLNGSIRGDVGTGDRSLILGFNIAGPGNKLLVTRAVGPTLQTFGLSDSATWVTMSIYTSGGNRVAYADHWDASASTIAAFNAVGAFGLAPGSQDSATEPQLAPDAYTLVVGGDVASQNHIAMAEVYDAEPASAARLRNISARGFVGGDSHDVIVGLVFAGNGPARFLLRAIGGSLRQFGVSGAIDAPQISVYTAGGRQLSVASSWTPTSEMLAFSTRMGAFPIRQDGSDAATICVLNPGAYTLRVSDTTNVGGLVLIEAYLDTAP